MQVALTEKTLGMSELEWGGEKPKGLSLRREAGMALWNVQGLVGTELGKTQLKRENTLAVQESDFCLQIRIILKIRI